MTDTEPSLSSRVIAGLLAGFIAGGGAGLIDGVVSWGPSAQFLPSVGGRLLFLLHQLASTGLVGAIIGVGVMVVAILLGMTPLGEAFAALRAPARRKFTMAAVVVAPLVFAVAGKIAMTVALSNLQGRRHAGLQLGVAMLLGIGALVGAVFATFLLALPLGRLLAAIEARSARFRRAIGHSAALAIVVGLLLVACAVSVAVYFRDMIAILPLRGVWVGLGAAAFAYPALRAGRVYARILARRRVGLRAGLIALVIAGSVGGALATGEVGGVRQSVIGFTGLGRTLLERYRAFFDFDGDGYSPILGGGDCDDSDPSINPGGTDIPGDGIDQNCIGGDASLQRDAGDAGFTEVPPEVASDANILLITIDTVRADHFGAYGYARDTTPRIDAVAEEGVVFENAWAHAPSTRYSMPAILSGRLPLDVYYDRSIRPWPGLERRATTLAEIMKDEGFETAAITNHWYFAAQRRLNQGFDHYDNSNATLHRQDARRGPATSHGSSSVEQTDAAIAILDELADERFFLWVHYYDPHHEYETHEGIRSFGDEPVDVYDHEILFTDHHVGRLLDDLEARGLTDETIVVITGDHGEGFGEHGVDFHGYHLYAPQTKVPLIVKIPGIAPRRVTTAVGHVDLLPTLANLVGAEPTDEMMGESLLDLAMGEAREDPTHYVFQQVAWTGNDIRGAASAECHVIYNVRPHSSWELYHLETDPDETRNIIDDPGACGDARAILEGFLDWSDLLPDGVSDHDVLDSPPTVGHRVDVEVGEELRLVGVDLPEEPVRRGRTFEITWVWQVVDRMTPGFRVFAHLKTQGGRFLGDHSPPRPFETWPEGRWVRYTTEVRVPGGTPSGRYEINFGVYRQRERKPLESDIVEITDLDEAKIGHIDVR